MLKYSTKNGLQDTAGWRWTARIRAIQNRLKLRAAALGESYDAEAILRRVASKQPKDEVKFGRVVPRIIKHALLLDLQDETDSSFWEKAFGQRDARD